MLVFLSDECLESVLDRILQRNSSRDHRFGILDPPYEAMSIRSARLII